MSEKSYEMEKFLQSSVETSDNLIKDVEAEKNQIFRELFSLTQNSNPVDSITDNLLKLMTASALPKEFAASVLLENEIKNPLDSIQENEGKKPETLDNLAIKLINNPKCIEYLITKLAGQ